MAIMPQCVSDQLAADWQQKVVEQLGQLPGTKDGLGLIGDIVASGNKLLEFEALRGVVDFTTLRLWLMPRITNDTRVTRWCSREYGGCGQLGVVHAVGTRPLPPAERVRRAWAIGTTGAPMAETVLGIRRHWGVYLPQSDAELEAGMVVLYDPYSSGASSEMLDGAHVYRAPFTVI